MSPSEENATQRLLGRLETHMSTTEKHQDRMVVVLDKFEAKLEVVDNKADDANKKIDVVTSRIKTEKKFIAGIVASLGAVWAIIRTYWDS